MYHSGSNCPQSNNRRIQMARSTSYGRKWKKWLAIYVVAGAIVYLIIYLAFFHTSGGSGGGGGLY